MSLPRYPKYKDSGVEWLDVVPEHWRCVRNKVVFQEVDDRSEDEDGELLTVSHITGVTPRSEKTVNMFLAETLEGYKKCKRGDLVINTMWAWMGALGCSPCDGLVSPSYNVYRPRPGADLLPAYYDFLCRIPAHRVLMKARSSGVWESRLRLYPAAFLDMELALPPPLEQEGIAAFLERETVKIDALVAEQERLIELLKEKRQAVISDAVTKGLNPKVPMKDSGIEWLGEIPAHWDVGPVKRFFVSYNPRRVPLSSEERGGRSGEFPYYGASGIIDHIDEYIFDEDLVLVGEDGANLLNRATPIAFVAQGRFWVNNHAHILKPLDAHLIYWAERIEAVDLVPFVSGSAQPKLTSEALMGILIAVPPTPEERAAIQAFIVRVSSESDALAAEAQRAIDLLQERRTALISAAVTGQVDVREVTGKAA